MKKAISFTPRALAGCDERAAHLSPRQIKAHHADESICRDGGFHD